MLDWNTAVDLLGACGLGGALVVAVQRLLPSRDVTQQTEATAEASFREALMRRIDAQGARITALEAELDRWKADYLKLAREYGELQLNHERMEAELAEVRGLCQKAGLTD